MLGRSFGWISSWRMVFVYDIWKHYGDEIMGTMASQITSLTIDYSTVNSDADQWKHQSSASLTFVLGIHRGPVNSPHKWPVTRKMFPFDDVIMQKRKTVQVIAKTMCLHWVLYQYMFYIFIFYYILAISCIDSKVSCTWSWSHEFPRMSDTLPCAHKPFVDHAVNCCHLTLARPLWVLFG